MIIGDKVFVKENAYIMGILNVTPDSFSDGGKWNNMDQALFHAEEMVLDGAAILDIGGESTRPGYKKISEEEEMERVIPYIEAIRKRIDVPISIDTYKAVVAKEAVKAGANLVNDIWGLKGDAKMAETVAELGISCCIMHNRDTEQFPYVNYWDGFIGDLKESIEIGRQAGIGEDKMILDPGIGFGKTLEQNLYTMKHLETLQEMGFPVLLGTSRKSMIGLTLDLPVTERLEGTLATTVLGMTKGVTFFRVHDVKENYRSIKMVEAMMKVAGC